MRAGVALERAYGAMAGVAGGITMALIKQKPVPAKTVKFWATQLRDAADWLDKLTEGK